MNPADGSASFNTALGGRTLAHELAHNLGRQHVDQTATAVAGGCSSNAPARPDMAYPYDGCAIAPNTPGDPATSLGFDMVSFQPVAPTAAGDLLSYAFARWPSDCNYNAMLDALGPAGPALQDAPPPPPGPYLLVRGLVDLAGGRVKLKPCLSLDEGIVPSEKVATSFAAATRPAGHGYVIRQLHAGGGVIGELPLGIEVPEDGRPLAGAFHQFIARPDGARGADRQGRRCACGGVGQRPRAGDRGGHGHLRRAAPGAQHIGGRHRRGRGSAALHRAVQQRRRRDVARAACQRRRVFLPVDARFLPGGTRCRVRVVAGDGFHGTAAVSTPFAMPTRAPEAFIGGVVEGRRLNYGTTEALLGFALDAEDGSLPRAALTWSLAGPTPRQAAGARLSLHGLAPGAYTATLATTDSSGQTGTVQRRFEILPVVVRDGPVPVVDGEANDTAYAQAPAVIWPAGGPATARLVHAEGHLHVVFTDLAYRGSGGQAAVAGLRVDVNGGGGALEAGDAGFFVTEEGTAYQMRANGPALQVNPAPSPGFKAVITRGPNGWNAELRVADALLGGWNHAARLLLEHRHMPADDPTLTVWPPGAGAAPDGWAPAWFGGSPPAPENRPPVALASAPAVLGVTEATRVTLDGTASFDPEDAPMTYAWTQVEGPVVHLENPATATPTFQFSGTGVPGTFRFQLVVRDGEHASAPAVVQTRLLPVLEQSCPLPPPAVAAGDGGMDVTLPWSGRGGERAWVQASQDLERWETLDRATVLHRDRQAGQFSHRFYRLADDPGPREPSPGRAFSFDGTDDSIEVPHHATLNAFPLTVSFWVKTSGASPTAAGLVNKYVDSSFDGWSVFLLQGRLHGWYFRGFANRMFPTDLGLDGGFIADGRWHHVAFIVDAAGGRFYVDGVERGAGPWIGMPGPCTTTRTVQFGRYNAYPVALHGALDDVSLWDRGFNPYEVIDLMNAGPAVPSPGLLGLWRGDETEGPAATDSSGNGRTGALLGGTGRVTSDAPIYAAP